MSPWEGGMLDSCTPYSDLAYPDHGHVQGAGESQITQTRPVQEQPLHLTSLAMWLAAICLCLGIRRLVRGINWEIAIRL
jgi:hypothetical protein